MRTSPSYDARNHYKGSVARRYAERRARDREWWREHEMMARLLRGLPRRQRVLDVPFGTGRFADLYASRGDHVVGADISPDMIRSALTLETVSSLGPLLVQADAVRLPFPDAAFDCVVCTRFFNWLPPDLRPPVLREFARLGAVGVLLQLRVLSETSPGRFAARLLEEVARDPGGAMLGRARGLRRRLAPGTGRSRESSPVPGGYSVPDEAELVRLFESAGVEAVRMLPIHANFDIWRHRLFEMRLYEFRPTR